MKRNSLAVLVMFAEVEKIDNYIFFLAEQIRLAVQRIVVTVNGKLDDESVRKLSSCADDIFIRENKGFDCGAYKDTLENYLGWEEVRKYDELILLNDSCYGPIYPLAPIFEQMDKRELDFWGITEQTPIRAGNYSLALLPYHVQTYFVVIGKRMLHSKDFVDFWKQVTLSDEYDDTVANFELRFTDYFNSRGYMSGAYVDCQAFCKSVDEMQAYVFMDSYYLVAEHGCPFVKKKVFLYPHKLVLSSNAGETAYKTLEYISEYTEYDEDLIWQHLIRKCEPEALYLSLHGNYCQPVDHTYRATENAEKLLVVVILTENEMTERCKSYVERLSSFVDVLVLDQGTDRDSAVDIKKYEYLCFLNNENGDQSLFSVFWENMIATPEYINNVLDIFEKKPRLGLLSPPKPYHAHYFSDRHSDCVSFPYGNMCWCKRAIFDRLWREKRGEMIDSKTFWHNLPYVAKDQGYACGVIMTEEYMSASLSDYHYMLSGIAKNILLHKGIQEFRNIRKINSELDDFCRKHSVCYIYGAGECGRECSAYLRLLGVNAQGYLVSDGRKAADQFEDLDLETFELSEINIDNDTGIIIAMNQSNTASVIKILEERGICEYVQYEA